MTKEQEEAIEKIKRKILLGKSEKNIGIPVYISELEMVLSILEEKEKVIDLMAEEIDKSMGNICPLVDYNYNLNCEKECNDDYKKCWKQYFENKAKEVE